MNKKVLVLCTTDSMIWNFLVPHIINLQENGYIVECVCSKTGDYFTWLQEKYGFIMHCVQFERNPFRIANIKAYFNLKRIVKKEGYNIIFCHEPVGGAMGRIVGFRLRSKVIYMAHGFHFYNGAPKSSRIYYYVEKTLSRFTDVLITINQEDYEASKKFHSKKIVKVNGIGINTKQFAYKPYRRYIRDELCLDDETIILLSVGELIRRKNHMSMILAMEFLPAKYHYVIVGDGELDERIKEVIHEKGLSERVHLLGYRKDVSAICNSSDVFIMPSYQEGISVAMMEAMACCLPVVASRIRGNTDLLDDGKGGFLVGVENSEEYANAIKQIDARRLYRTFGEYNREKLKNFDLDYVCEQIEDIFKEM